MGWCRVLVVIVASSGIAAAVACSSFSAADGSSPAGDAEASTADAGSGDAGSEAGWIPCSARPIDPAHFCEDFDRPGTITFGWNVDTGGATPYETDAALSTPRALAIRTDGPKTDAYATLRYDLGPKVDATKAQKVTVALGLRLGKPPYPADGASGYAHAAVLELDPNDACDAGRNLREVDLTMYPNGNLQIVAKGLRDECSDYTPETLSYSVADLVSDSRYVRLTFDLSRTGCSGAPGAALRAVVAGDTHPPTCIDLGAGRWFDHAKRLQLAMGLVGRGVLADTEIVYDNVTVDVE